MNKQQSEASSPHRRPRQPRESESRPLQGPGRGCQAPAPPPSFARSSAEGAQDSVTGIVNSSNLYVHSSSIMSRPTVLHICLAFCSLLLLNFTTQCLGFPKVGRREIAHEKMDTGDQESSSVAPEYKPQLMSSEDLMVLSAGPSVTPLNKVLPINEESHLSGAGLLYPNSPGLHSATESAAPAEEEEQGPRQPKRTSPEHRLSKAMLTFPVTATTSLNSDQEGPFSSSSVQPLVEEITEATQGFLKYTDNQFFGTESQEGASLGQSPLSYINPKEMLTADPRTEQVEADVTQRTTSFPGVDFIADTEPGGKKPSQTEAIHMLGPAPKDLPATSESGPSVDPETDSVLGASEVTVSVSTAVPVVSVLSEEWDDTKLESVSQMRPPKLGDSADTQLRTEASQTAHASPLEGTEGSPTSTEAAEVAPQQAEGEPHAGTTLLTVPEDERSPVFTHLSSFTPSGLTEDTEVSILNLLPNTGGSTAPTAEDSITLFSETTISLSQYESEAYQPVGNVLQDITQEMTRATQEPDAALPLVTEEQVATIEVPRVSGEPEEGKVSPSQVSNTADATQLSRIWESLVTPASTSAVSLSFEVTSAEDLLDTVTGPNEEFIPVLGSPVTSSAGTVEAPTISPVLPSEESTAPSVSHSDITTSYGLEQLESEEEEDEDEEDEDEDEDEDEEEDEEDKDADSLTENFDGDTELPGFTVPGVTSQEPDIEPGSLDLLERATYQGPDAIEWEQQNQGLVRNWMEKLKDKAGYMSGMLVPVGVGIAGALFILGALYSIKVMNRRRRNGFKRHKRKQREFNSMQDRVMLLADSSEDEF